MRNANQTTSWTLTVRLTHWLIALGVTISFVNDTGYWHRMIGYGCLLLVAIRLVHGLIAKQKTSHFYWPSIDEILAHIAEVQRGEVTEHNGHNPIGQIAVYLMWLLIIFLGLSGWLSRTDAFWGEDGPVLVHACLAYVLMLCAFLHVVAVLFMSKLQKKNLIKPMIVSTKHQQNKS